MRALLADARRRLLAGAVRVAAVLGSVLLAVVYWLVLGPVALALRALGVDLLGVRGKRTTAWTPVDAEGARERLTGAG